MEHKRHINVIIEASQWAGLQRLAYSLGRKTKTAVTISEMVRQAIDKMLDKDKGDK